MFVISAENLISILLSAIYPICNYIVRCTTFPRSALSHRVNISNIPTTSICSIDIQAFNVQISDLFTQKSPYTSIYIDQIFNFLNIDNLYSRNLKLKLLSKVFNFNALLLYIQPTAI